MTSILVGLDGSTAGERALAQAKKLSTLIGNCELVLAFVIEWTPYSFHTPEELAERHKRRESEIDQAHACILQPAAKALEAEGFKVSTVVRHGDPADLLDKVARETGASFIIVGRTGHRSLRDRLFGSVAGNLAAAASVPVAIIP